MDDCDGFRTPSVKDRMNRYKDDFEFITKQRPGSDFIVIELRDKERNYSDRFYIKRHFMQGRGGMIEKKQSEMRAKHALFIRYAQRRNCGDVKQQRFDRGHAGDTTGWDFA